MGTMIKYQILIIHKPLIINDPTEFCGNSKFFFYFLCNIFL